MYFLKNWQQKTTMQIVSSSNGTNFYLVVSNLNLRWETDQTDICWMWF